MSVRIPLRLLELNSPMMWYWPHIEEVVQLMRRQHFNGLIFHQENMWSFLASPSVHVRSGKENLARARTDALLFLKRVCRYCKQYGIHVWLQGDCAPDDGKLRQKYPEYELMSQATEKEIFWQRFYQQTLDELYTELPDINGILINLMTVSHEPVMSANIWDVMYRTTRNAGKRLIVREGEGDKWQQWNLSTVLRCLPIDVRILLKATTCDYRPGAPNNPLIADLPGRLKWIEYDLWGSEFGWTLLPCYLLDEIHGRLCWADAVAGEELEAITCKMSWEWVSNSSLVDSINNVNLQGLAMCSYQLEMNEQDAYRCWLNDCLGRTATAEEYQLMHPFSVLSYQWIKKTGYVLSQAIHSRSQIPASYQQALQLLFAETTTADRNLQGQALFHHDDALMGYEELQLVILEKEQATFLAQRLRYQAHEITSRIPLPPTFHDLILRVYERVPWYTRMFTHVAQAVCARYYLQRYGYHSDVFRLLNREIEMLAQLAGEIDHWLDQGRHKHPHYLPLLFDSQRINHLVDDLMHQK